MRICLLFFLLANVCTSQPKSFEEHSPKEFIGAQDGYGLSPLVESGVPNALDTFVYNSGSGSTWTKTSSFSVADVSGGNPNDIVQYTYEFIDSTLVKYTPDDPFGLARLELFNDGKKYIGCGINALYSELEYFGKYGHLDLLGVNDEGQNDYCCLAKYVIENTATIPIGDNLFTTSSDILRSFNSAMTHFGYNNILSLKKATGSPSAFIESINQGYPILWGCALNGSISNSHYLIVYGYEYWSCVDSNNVTHTYPMFKVRYNWSYDVNTGPNINYIHPEMFNYLNVAFYPQRVRRHYILNDDDITNECYYPFTSVQHTISTIDGTVTGTHLRTGYVTDSDGKSHLTMSARRKGAGVAQIVLTFPVEVSEVYWKYSLWGPSEQFDFASDTFSFEGKSYDGPWQSIESLPLYLITSHRERPERYHKIFYNGYTSLRITLVSSAVGDRNKGRVVFKNIMVFGNNFIN